MASTTFSSPNAFKDLLHRIHRTHLQYLGEDKSTNKIKYRNMLENYMKEFLSNEHHKNKFNFSKTAEILHRSVQSKNFNALKTAGAWSALSTYANNLYNQPWRKEYHEIQLYSGFYKHQIECNLPGVEAMLEIMGYRHVDHKMVLEEPLDADLLRKTSLDALMAMCECQILFNVYEEVSRHIPNCTWLDMLEFRELYPGSTDQTIDGILRLYNYSKNCCIDCFDSCGTDFKYPLSNNLQSGYRCCQDSPLKQQSCVQVNGHCMNYRGAGGGASSYPYTEERGTFTNGHYSQVPTAKLIDLDDSFECNRLYPHRKSSADSWAHDEHSRFVDDFSSESNISPFEEKNVRKRDRIRDFLPKRSDRANSRKSWDYVYKELDKEQHPKAKYQLNPRSLNISKASSKSNGISSPLSNLKLGSDAESRTAYVVNADLDNRKRINVPVKPTSLQLNRPNVNNNYSASRSVESMDKASPTTWACLTCTFRNVMSRDVCEICSKSRNVSDDKPLISGGKHCNACTLVNRKEAIKCEACGSPLENSPTYV